VTWEETILFINSHPEYRELVINSYLETDLKRNIDRYRMSEEFLAISEEIRSQLPGARNLIDIGSGNGISAIAFALAGFLVTAVEPFPSDIVGTGAIRKLAEIYGLSNITVIESTGEEFKCSEPGQFDVAFIRQTLHHAQNLRRFIANVSAHLRSGGMLITVRDHVINGKRDKIGFLKSHPLEKFYHGENAFTLKEYENAFTDSGFQILKKLGHFDSVINYYPMTEEQRRNYSADFRRHVNEKLGKKLGPFSKLPIVEYLYKKLKRIDSDYSPDEKKIPGRLYSFFCLKK
jgi:SAM-dependent methyltransferase